jgi:hypothetical protein
MSLSKLLTLTLSSLANHHFHFDLDDGGSFSRLKNWWTKRTIPSIGVTRVMSRGQCTFGNLNETYNFVQRVPDRDHEAYCTICKRTFSIKNKGKYDVQQHALTEKHKKASSLTVKDKILSYFHKAVPNSESLKLAKQEITWCYHNVAHGHSFVSMDCTSKLMKKFVDPKFSCARTKTKAAITNVISKWSDEVVQTELSKSDYVVISCDASNHGSIKLLPVLIRFVNWFISCQSRVRWITLQ